MNIWIFNPYEPLPHEGAVRLRYASLAEALIAQGHFVTWWSADWSHAHKRRRKLPLECGKEGKWKSGKVEGSEGSHPQKVDSAESLHSSDMSPSHLHTFSLSNNDVLSVVLIPVPAYQKNISLARIWSHWRYAKGIETRAADHAAAQGAPDVILFSVPPMEAGRVALKLGQKFGAKVVLDVMDAWPDALLLAAASGKVGRCEGVKVSVAQALLAPYYGMMRRYCREADAVCAQSQAFAEYARSFGASGEISVFHLAAHQPSRLSTYEPHDLSTPSVLRLLYLGSMGRIYDLTTLVDVVIQLSNEGLAIHLDVIGDGEQRLQLESKVAEAGKADVVTIHGYVQGAPLDALMAQAQVGVIPMRPDSAVAIPYKAPHYLCYGLYVLSSLTGELMQQLEQAGCGAYYRVGDAEHLAAVIRSLANDSAALQRGKAQALQLFSEQFESGKVHAAMAEWLCGLRPQ